VCVGYNVLERIVFGEKIGDLIRNCTVANVIQYCINFEERGRSINLNFNAATKNMNE